MSELGSDAPAEGRPTTGQARAQNPAEAAQRRGKSRNIGALGRLIPFAAGHRLDALAAGVFLVAAAGTSLGLTGGARLVVDNLTNPKGGAVNGQTVAPWFWLMGGIALA